MLGTLLCFVYIIYLMFIGVNPTCRDTVRALILQIKKRTRSLYYLFKSIEQVSCEARL